MDVELPSSGCNILTGANSFYNYSLDGRTRQTFAIYEGQVKMVSETYNQYGYTYTGTCLSTGDLVYKPELKIYFSFISAIIFIFSLYLIYRVIFKRLLP